MKNGLLFVMRLALRLINLIALAVLLLVLAIGVGTYLTIHGGNLPLLREVTTRLGQLFDGQHTDDIKLAVEIFPNEGRIAATATLTVRSLTADRSHFYFLFNNALRMRDFRINGAAANRAHAYRLWLLTVVDLEEPVQKDAAVELTFDYAGTLGNGLFALQSSEISSRQVLLNADSFWYPTDAQGPFSADVSITLPQGMTVVHNGTQAKRLERGKLQQVHWTTERPVAGLALVAGTYNLTSRTSQGITYRVFLADDVRLDAKQILESMAGANRLFTERYGSCGFNQTTLFVSRDLRRGFNDGSGLIGLSIRYFRTGDYGFALIAHELAHNWWGDTVAENWLNPGTGGEWIVEGMSEASSLIATEAQYGAPALAHRLASEFYDPALQTSLSQMSVLDNVLNEATARDTIYRKGAYVAMMLRHMLGDDVFFKGLRQFFERFRYQQVGDAELQATLQEVSGTDLQSFFVDWVRSDHLLDLSLDTNSQDELTVSNLGQATAPSDIQLWSLPKQGGEPQTSTVHIGDKLTFSSANTEAVVLDPALLWADVSRSNNRYPRRNDPLFVNASASGPIAITESAGFPWSRTTISLRVANRTEHTWDFERGVLQPPVWSADGTQLIVSLSDPTQAFPPIVILDRDGSRRNGGHGSAPSPSSDGSIFAAKKDRIVRASTDGDHDVESTLVRQSGYALDLPIASPDGKQLAYTAARGNRLDFHVLELATLEDRVLCSWDRDHIIYRWGQDGLRLFAVVGGNWDWQVWEIPLQAEAVRILASDAAMISDLALSPDGRELAFSAAPGLDYPSNRRHLYVLDLQERTVKAIDASDLDFGSITWADAQSVLAVVTAASAAQPWTLPATRSLKQIRLADASILPY